MQQSRDFFHICYCKRPLRLASLASSPKGGAKGRALPARCRGIVGADPAAQPPLALPMGELARLKAVTERA